MLAKCHATPKSHGPSSMVFCICIAIKTRHNLPDKPYKERECVYVFVCVCSQRVWHKLWFIGSNFGHSEFLCPGWGWEVRLYARFKIINEMIANALHFSCQLEQVRSCNNLWQIGSKKMKPHPRRSMYLLLLTNYCRVWDRTRTYQT